jgi:hypothetical protein
MPSSSPTGVLSELSNWVGSAFSSAMEKIDAALPGGIAFIVVVAGLALFVFGVRRVFLFWRGRSPRVQISPFSWTGPAEQASEAIWITSLFREQLKQLRLDSLDPLPDRAPGAPVVEIIEGVGQGVTQGLDIGRAIGRLWQAAIPG